MFQAKVVQNITYREEFDTYNEMLEWISEECRRFYVKAVYCWEDHEPIEAIEAQDMLAASWSGQKGETS